MGTNAISLLSMFFHLSQLLQDEPLSLQLLSGVPYHRDTGCSVGKPIRSMRGSV